MASAWFFPPGGRIKHYCTSCEVGAPCRERLGRPATAAFRRHPTPSTASAAGGSKARPSPSSPSPPQRPPPACRARLHGLQAGMRRGRLRRVHRAAVERGARRPPAPSLRQRLPVPAVRGGGHARGDGGGGWQHEGRAAPRARAAGQGARLAVRLLHPGLCHVHGRPAARQGPRGPHRGGDRGEPGGQPLVRFAVGASWAPSYHSRGWGSRFWPHGPRRKPKPHLPFRPPPRAAAARVTAPSSTPSRHLPRWTPPRTQRRPSPPARPTATPTAPTALTAPTAPTARTAATVPTAPTARVPVPTARRAGGCAPPRASPATAARRTPTAPSCPPRPTRRRPAAPSPTRAQQVRRSAAARLCACPRAAAARALASTALRCCTSLRQ
jgi:hypothetical protein